ncbi:MAG: hypothetical protein WBQ86_06525 [Candidatus Binatus sp.]
MTEEIKSPGSSRKRPKKRIEKGFGGSVASRKIADAVGAAAKTVSITNVSKPTGGLESRQQSGEKAMAEKENGTMYEGLTSIGSLFTVKGAKKFAAWYIDTSEKVAKQAIDFQENATKWAKETPLAPIFDAQIEYGKKFVERSATAARSLWRIEE